SGCFSLTPRFEGFRDAMNDFGIACDRGLVYELKLETPTSPYKEAVREAVEYLVSKNPRPDAIVCSNDLEAMVCLKELQSRGLAVPKDIAVVGFDDLKDASRCEPPLTTIHNPMNLLGLEAAKLILSIIEDPTRPTQSIVLPVTLVPRESA
ncbi:MAG: substrate-binding domain-containing protein, partial [Verrucomicrobiota bacterium]